MSPEGDYVITASELSERLPHIFTPAAPVSDVRLLCGRWQVRSDISDAIARRGAHIVLYGERGVGKSSIAKIELQFAPDKTFYYSVSADDTFETIATAMLQAYNVGWTPQSRSHDNTRRSQGSIEIHGVA